MAKDPYRRGHPWGLAHMKQVKQLPCAACIYLGRQVVGPSHAHHINSCGMGMKASDFEVIPLCDDHHDKGIPGVSVHAGLKVWAFDEHELLEWVWGVLLAQRVIPRDAPACEPYPPRKTAFPG